MTLPFPKENDKPKYQCFVCGVMFEEFDKFKNHIIEEHEEGRDYVKCPLERCGAPVRDVRLHFKVKHPHEQMPKKGQMKAMIWRDFSLKGKGRTKKPKFRQGWYESTKMKKRFYYRSGYEEQVFECLDMHKEVMAFEVEPFQIPYIFKGENHEYVPDILVTFFDGHREIWEIKPKTQTALEQNQAKWTAAAEACKIRGWRFVVQTEIGIRKLKKLIEEQTLQTINENQK
jgi:hypothetical protein